MIFNIGNARCGPRCALRFFAFDERFHAPSKGYFAIARSYGNPLGIHFGSTFQRLNDLAFDICRRDDWLQVDPVDHAFHAEQTANRPLGFGSFVLELDSPVEGDPSLLYEDLDPAPWR